MNLKNLMNDKKVAFTLAEVVVVMAILAVMMAAFAPVVTKKTISAGANNNKTLFDIMPGNSGVYFGSTGDTKSVVIGDRTLDAASNNPKLLLISSAGATSGVTPQIGFGNKIGDEALAYTGQLLMDASAGSTTEGNLIVGGTYDTIYPHHSASFSGNTIIGVNAGANDASNITAIGNSAGTGSASNVTAIGNNACSGAGASAICIGQDAGANANAHSIYIGNADSESTAAIYIGSNTIDDGSIYFGDRSLGEYIDDKIMALNPDTFATKDDTAAVSGNVSSLASDVRSLNTKYNTLQKSVRDLDGRVETLEKKANDALPLTPSDIRLKNVGKEYTAGLDELNQLTFYHYTYKRDVDKTPRVGVMAQDLQKVFPDAVSENKDGYLYIRKDDMFYAALNAIKELFEKVTGNSARIKELEERNAVLEKQVKELQEMYVDLAKQTNAKSAKKKLTQTPKKVVVEEVSEPQEQENQE